MTGPDREREVIGAFIGFADALVDEFDVLDLTIQLTEDCARLLDVAAAGLLLADTSGLLQLLASTSEQARSLELFQLQREQGPCLDCYRTGRPVSVPDLHEEVARWPQFVAKAAQHGFASAHAIPLQLRGSTLGALGLFGVDPGALSEDDLKLAQALAHVACIALVQQHRHTGPGALAPTLQRTVSSRRLFEMAKGVIAEVYQLSMDEAAHRLRRYAHGRGVGLTEVARTVVTIRDPRQAQLLADLGTVAGPARESDR